MKILIVDDHVIFRAGLTQLLLHELRNPVIEEAGDGMSALYKLPEKKWDIILLDINLPDKNGIEVLKSIKQSKPEQPVLMLSMYSEDQYAVRALRAGAAGYLTKETSPDELINAIKQVATGRKYISNSLAHIMATHLQEDENNDNPHKSLSDREYDIFIRIASGKTVSQIADQLKLSVKTISTYRTRVLKKMNLQNNAELVQYAVHNNIQIETQA